MPRVQDQVAENRRGVQRIDGRFIFVPERQGRNLTFARNDIDVSVELSVYTRPLNGGLVSGHRNGDQHGSGHGVAGDVRGDWTLQTADEASADWAVGGRAALRDSMAGETGSIDSVAVGTGGTLADLGDTALASRTGSTSAYGVRSTEANNAVRARANFRYAETGGGGLDPLEYGLFDSSGRLMARLTTEAVPVAPDEEVRVDVTVTVQGDGNGTSAITDGGEAALADSLQLESVVVGLDELAWGTGTTQAAESDTALEDEKLRKVVDRARGNEVLTVSAPQFEGEPSTQPHDYTEVGVFDNTGRLVWRTTMDPFEKNENVRFATFVGFRIR